MNRYRTFVGIGLITGGIGEFLNHVVIMQTPGGFLFAMGFYTGTLSVAYLTYQWWVIGRGRVAVLIYSQLWGVVFGLLITEWWLIGHHPANPTVASPISQLAMVAYHTVLYTAPVLASNGVPGGVVWLRRYGRWAAVYGSVIVAGAGLLLVGQPALVLPFGIFFLYFVGYNIFWIGMMIFLVRATYQRSTRSPIAGE